MYFKDRVSEWNPCFGDDEEVRFLWDREVGAHDIEVDLDVAATDSVDAAGDGDAGVRLRDYCPDVAETPHSVRLSSLLERVLLDEDRAPRDVVDLNVVRQLVSAFVNCGGRHTRHGKDPPGLKDPCQRGKPSCSYCRYGFPHPCHARKDGVRLEAGDREGQWQARFPRNDELVCSYEPHVLLANAGNID